MAVTLDIANSQLSSLLLKMMFELRPDRLSNVDAGISRAFLALVLECCADSVEGCDVHIGRGMNNDPVLASCFVNNAGIGIVISECPVSMNLGSIKQRHCEPSTT